MQKKTILVLSILGGIVLLAFMLFGWVVGMYNSLVRLDEGIKQSWAQVQNQYQRRYDLIPNLVNTVKGYAPHESGVFENLA